MATNAPNEYTTFFAGVADDISWLNYALDEVTFLAEDPPSTLLTDTTCEVYFLVSDLGYNGLPAQYLGDPPFGLEIPFFGFDLDTNFAPGVEEVVVQIGAGTEIDVTLPTDGAVAEGASGTVPLTITPAQHPAFDVTISSADGLGAAAPGDYAALANVVVNIPADATTANVPINAAQDSDFDPGETYTLTVTPPGTPPPGYTVTSSDPSATVTITDDDPEPDRQIVSIGDVTLAEGDAGTTNFVFTVTLDGPAVGDESVSASTAHISTDATDLIPLTNTPVTFLAGATTATITVPVSGDTDVEPDETFTLTLANPQNVTIAGGVGPATGTIQNDDGAQADRQIMSIGDVSVDEGNAGTTSFVFTLTLDGPAAGDEAVAASTAHVSTNAVDLTPLTNTPVTFVAGATTATVTVLVNGDTDFEPDESFSLTLSSPQNVTIAAGADDATGTIQNDDAEQPDREIVAVSDVTLAEGDASTTNFIFTITLDGPAVGDESVSVSTAHVSTDAVDLTPLTNSPVTFVAGATSATVTVLVSGDTDVEPDETFTVTLSSPQEVSIDGAVGPATGTIQNDDGAQADAQIISLGDVTLAEGNAGTTDFVFTVTLDGPALGNETVSASTAHVSTDAVDLTPLTNSPVTFVAGATSATITVPVSGDTDVEPDETFTLTLSNPQNVTIAAIAQSATGTIQNDDLAAADREIVSISDVALAEGDAGTTNFAFTVTLDGPAVGDETVAASTAHVSTDAVDLTPLTSSPVTFLAGSTTATVIVPVSGDTDVEPDETFTLTLSNPENVTIAAAAQSATGTIENDDVDDGGGQPDPLTITVPADITVLAEPGQAGAVVSYPAPTTTGGVAPVTISCTSQSGAFYPLGVTTVTCTATDSDPLQQGQAVPLAIVADSFTITVVQNQPPAIADNPDITRFTTDDGVVVVFSPPGATDDSGIPPTVTCNPPSGTLFTVGTHVVTCTATDGAGLQATSSFTITVDGSAQLPATGSDMRGLLLMAAGSVLLGVLLLRQRRRLHLS